MDDDAIITVSRVLAGTQSWAVVQSDALALLQVLPTASVSCCVTSPPYWGLRDYGVPGQYGLEATPEQYTARLVEVFAEVRRVLRDDGTLWLNLGDCYCTVPHGHRGANAADPKYPVARLRGPGDQANRKRLPGLKHKDLVGIPWMVAFALRADGWYLRSEIIWVKKSPLPESVRDRPTKTHEQIFLLTKSPSYYFDHDAVREPLAASTIARDRHRRLAPTGAPSFVPGAPDHTGLHQQSSLANNHEAPTNPLGRNIRDVWQLGPEPFAGAHFAVMPTALVVPCVKAGCPVEGVVLDPFAGSGTVGLVARRLDRRFLGIELNTEFAALARQRIRTDALLFNHIATSE